MKDGKKKIPDRHSLVNKQYIAGIMKPWIVNIFLYNFYKDTFLYSIGVK